MKICFFGNFDPDYNRNLVLLEGFLENNIEVIICRTDLKGLKGVCDLWRKHRNFAKQYDILFVAYSDSRFLVPLARILSKKKIVWDAFYSLYDSIVHDRKLASPRSLKALYLWSLDWLSCSISDRILLDTQSHIEYFCQEFSQNQGKFTRVLIGASRSSLLSE